MYQFLWIFFVYAFLGWCTEVSYAALNTGRFVNRGFLNGPVCPIYGFGVVIVLGCLTPLKENLFILFAGSMLLTSALEWLTGFVLEKLFHQRWWDYSDEHFNLGGYICLKFSIMWGFACVFVVKLLHPTILLFIRLIPHTFGMVLLGLLSALMAVDLTATVRTIINLNHRLEKIDELAAHIREASSEFGESLADRVLDAAEKGEEFKEDMDELLDKLADQKERLEDTLAEQKERLEDSLAERREALEEDLLEYTVAVQLRHKASKEELRAQAEQWKQALDELLDSKGFGQRRLLHAFPKLRSVKHTSTLERLRRKLKKK